MLEDDGPSTGVIPDATTPVPVMTMGTEPGGSGDSPSPKEMAAAAPAEASKVASTALSSSKDVANEVVAQASNVVDQAKQQLTTVVGQTKDELHTQLDARGQQAAGALRTLSGQLSALGDGRPGEAGQLPSLLADVEGRVRGVVDLLERGGPQAVGDRVTSFARRRPVMFLVASGVAGFVVGRAVRSGVAASHAETESDGRGSIGHGNAAPAGLSGGAVGLPSGSVAADDGFPFDNSVATAMP